MEGHHRSEFLREFPELGPLYRLYQTHHFLSLQQILTSVAFRIMFATRLPSVSTQLDPTAVDVTTDTLVTAKLIVLVGTRIGLQGTNYTSQIH